MSVQTINNFLSANKRLLGLLLIVVVGMCASVLMYWITDQGIGVDVDSITYIEAARNFLAGNGFFVYGNAMTHYPPVYPLLLAMVGLVTHADILFSARLLGTILFGVNIVLFVLAVNISTKHNLVATGCAILFFLFSAQTIFVHSMAYSEAPFIMFSMACFLLLSYHISRPRTYLLVSASLMAGFAAITRYAGVVIFPTIVLSFFILDKRPIKSKKKDIAIFAGIAFLPLTSWIIRNILISQSPTNRMFVFHPFSFDHVKTFIITMHDFILPIPVLFLIKAIHVGVAVALFLWGFAIIYRKTYNKNITPSTDMVLPFLCFMYSTIYTIFLLITISFFDAEVPLTPRILLPSILSLTIAGFSLAWLLSEKLIKRWIWFGFVLFSLFSVYNNQIPAILYAQYIHNNGGGYTSRYWNNSKIIAYLSDFPDARSIYSNGSDMIRFLTGKEAVMIPSKKSPGTRRVNEDYDEKMGQMIRKCREGKALIVYFNEIKWRWYMPSIEEIESAEYLPVLSRTKEGVIYGTR